MVKIERNFDTLIQEMSSTESLISSLEKQLIEANDRLVDLKDQKRYMFGNDNLYVNMESLLNKYDFDGDGIISIIDYYIWYGFNNNDSFVIDNPKYNSNSKTFNGKSLEGIDLSKKMFNTFMNNVNKGIYKCVDNNIFKSYLNNRNTDLVYKVIKGYWESLKVIPTLNQVNNIWLTDNIDIICIDNTNDTDNLLPTGTSNTGYSGDKKYILDRNGNIDVEEITDKNDIIHEYYNIEYWCEGRRDNTGVFDLTFYPTEFAQKEYIPGGDKSLCEFRIVYKKYRLYTKYELADGELGGIDATYVPLEEPEEFDVPYGGMFRVKWQEEQKDPYNKSGIGNYGDSNDDLPEANNSLSDKIWKISSKDQIPETIGWDYIMPATGFRTPCTLYNSNIYPEPPAIKWFNGIDDWIIEQISTTIIYQIPTIEQGSIPGSTQEGFEWITVTFHGNVLWDKKNKNKYDEETVGEWKEYDYNEVDEWSNLTYEEAFMKAPHIFEEQEYVNDKLQLVSYYKTKNIANTYLPLDFNSNNYILKSKNKIFGTNYPYIFNFQYYYWESIEGETGNLIPTESQSESKSEYQYFNPEEFMEATSGTNKHFILWFNKQKFIYTEEEYAIWYAEFGDWLENNNVFREYTNPEDGYTYYTELPPCPGFISDYVVKTTTFMGITYYAWFSIYDVATVGDFDAFNGTTIKCKECGANLPLHMSEKLTGSTFDSDLGQMMPFEISVVATYEPYFIKTKPAGNYIEHGWSEIFNHHIHTYKAWINQDEIKKHLLTGYNEIGNFGFGSGS